jgi:hypothetical protein
MAPDRRRHSRHNLYRPAVARACGIVLAATVLAVVVLPFSAGLAAVAAIAAVIALAVWVREQARRGGNRYQSSAESSFDNSSDYTYGSAFDGGAASAFSTQGDSGDDSRSCRFDSSFDSSSGSFDSGSSGSDSGSSDCGGSSGGD